MSVAFADVPVGHVGDFYRVVGGLIPDAVTVYEGNVPDKPSFPYAVLWGSFGDEVSESLCDVPDVLRVNFRVTYVGLSLASAAWVASKVRPALNRSKPYVHGWVSGRMRQAALMDIQTDFTVTLTDGSHPVYAVDEFALIAHKL